MLAAPPLALLPPDLGTCLQLPAVFSPAECRAWIAAAEARGFEPTGGTYPPSYRDNDRLVQDDPALAATLFLRLREHLPGQLLRDGARWTLVGLNPRFRACRYRDGQRFGVHRDGPHAPSPDVRSFLTCMLYLDDPTGFDGGATVFHADRAARGAPLLVVPPREGAALVFDHALWHEGQAVHRGTKHVLRTDVLYRREGPGSAPPRDPRCALLAGHTGYVWQVARLASGALVSGSRDGSVLRWDEGAPRRLLAQEGSVTALAQDAAGDLWTGGREGCLRRWALGPDGARLVARLDDEGAGAILALLALPDGGLAVARAGGAVEVRAPGGALTGRREEHRGWVWALAWEQGRLVSAGEDGALRAWAAEEASRLLVQEPAPVRALLALPGGGLAWGTAAGQVRRRAPGGAPVAVGAHAGAVRALAALPDGALASGGEDDLLRVWGPDGETRAALPHGDFVTSLVPLPGGALASGSYDGRVRVWSPGALA